MGTVKKASVVGEALFKSLWESAFLADFKRRHGISLLLGGVRILFALLAGCVAESSTSGPKPRATH